MRILIAIHHFPPKFTGGAEWEAYRTAVELKNQGHAVKVICVEEAYATDQQTITWKDSDYDGVPVRRLYLNLASAPDTFRWEYDNLWIGEQLQILMEDFRPDIFHLFGGYLISGRAILVALQQQVPCVVTLMDFWFLCKRISLLKSNGQLSLPPVQAVECIQCLGEEKRRFQWLRKISPKLAKTFWKFHTQQIEKIATRQKFLIETINKTNLILSRSNFLLHTHQAAGVNPSHMIFLRQGRDFPGLQPEHILKTPSDILRVGYLGQIAPHKGIDTLLDAIQQIPPEHIHVTIYGDPRPFPKYYRRLQKYCTNDNIVLAGTYSQSILSQVVSNLDVIVVPSRWYENSPNVILEAFAHKTPVIASNLGGMAELVKHEQNGLLFDTDSPDSLAKQIQRLLDEPDLLPRLKQGIEPVKSVSEEVSELEQIYLRVANEQVP